jgi:hypothetical protein
MDHVQDPSRSKDASRIGCAKQCLQEYTTLVRYVSFQNICTYLSHFLSTVVALLTQLCLFRSVLFRFTFILLCFVPFTFSLP